MQHYQTEGLQGDKSQHGRESKMAGLGFQNTKMKKICVELGHSDLLSVYKSSFTKMPLSQETLNRF